MEHRNRRSAVAFAVPCAERMRLYRKRHRKGIRCVRDQLRVTETGGFALRVSTSLVVIAFVLAGALGKSAAQSYAPPPADYYPEPPAPYPNQPQPYTSAPLPPPNGRGQATELASGPYGPAPSIYREANGMPPRPYDPGYDEQAEQSPPPGRPYFVPEDRITPQPPPSVGGEPIPRPPANVGGGPPPADITGSVRAPVGAVAGPALGHATVIAALPPEDQPEQDLPRALPPQFRRQLVDYVTSEPAGTVIIDTPHTYLYLVRGSGKALRYGIGVGREGFTWSGSQRISRMSEWPDWHPPKEMIERQPYLPRFMAGGEGNPLGARALYLGNTIYRIHGTNQPSTIGSFVSSGCIRLTNENIEDLYSRVNIGTRVVVLPGSPPASASTRGPIAQ
jgi:lipoprotein-anchoring transpeptidase ErfK/SrfK